MTDEGSCDVAHRSYWMVALTEGDEIHTKCSLCGQEWTVKIEWRILGCGDRMNRIKVFFKEIKEKTCVGTMNKMLLSLVIFFALFMPIKIWAEMNDVNSSGIWWMMWVPYTICILALGMEFMARSCFGVYSIKNDE